MKRKPLFILLTFIALSISFSANAQHPIVVNNTPSPINMDTQRSFVVVIPQTHLKEVSRAWQKYTGKGSKGKSSQTDGVYVQAGTVSKNIAPAPFNLYSRLVETKEGVRLNVWLDESSRTTVPNSGQHLAVQKYVYDFALSQYRDAVKEELKTEQKKLHELEKDLARLIRGEDKSSNAISKNERATDRANDAIATNRSDIEKSDEKISDQKDNVERNAADYNAAKGARKTLGELEDDKKGLQKSNEKQGKNIDQMNKENRASARSIASAQENQQTKITAVEQQKEVVRAVQTKLAQIK
jgi:hypothetical protein